MPQLIQFEGQTHQFPDDFTAVDIQRALSSVRPAAAQKLVPVDHDPFAAAPSAQKVHSDQGRQYAVPPLPPGFKMDAPPLPPGFTLDPPAVAPSVPISQPDPAPYGVTPGGVPIGPDGRPRVVIAPERADRPPALLPTSVGGAARDFTVGAQGVGKGITDIVTGPFDLVAGVQNAATAGLNTVLGPNIGKIPYATPASKIVENAVDAVGLPFIDPDTMSKSEKLAYDVNRFGTQAVGTGAMLAQRAPQIRLQTTPSPTFAGRVADTFARPYAEAPGYTAMGDAVGGIGAGIAVNAVDNLVPHEAAVGGTAPKQVANALAPVVGAVGANTIQGGILGLAGMLRNLARNQMTPPAPVPLNPETHRPYTNTEVDRAAATMQAVMKNPALSARTIRENAEELSQPQKPGETPVPGSQMPTSGLLSQEPSLVTLEEQSRLKNRAPFIERDQGVKEGAAERVEGIRDPEADLGAVIRRAAEARGQRLGDADEAVLQADDAVRAVEQARQDHGASLGLTANSEHQANASRRLDRALVEDTYIPARTDKNRQFDTAPGRNEQLPADEVFAVIDRIRLQANGLVPGTLPNDFIRRIDRLRPRIDPDTGENMGGPGTALGADLADLRKFLAPAAERAQASGNFDLADNLNRLRRAINRTLGDAPGYAEANANYQRFAERFRPEPRDEMAIFTREIDRGGQNVDGELNRGGTPPSETAGRFLTSAEKAATLPRALEGSPAAAAGHTALRDYLRADFAMSALNADGTVNVIRANSWVRNNADVLAQFPAVRQEFDDLVGTARRGEQLSAQAKADLEAARAARNATEAEIDRSAVGTLLREDARDVANKLLSGGYNSEKKLEEIGALVRHDEAARRGWKAAVAEVLADRVQGTRQVGESLEVQFARLAKEFKDNEALLAKTFSPEEMNNLRQAHKLLSYFKEAEKRATVGSQTAERTSIIPPELALAARHLYGDLKGGGIIKRFRLMLELLPSSRQGAEEIVHAAWFDPNLAAFLLDRKLPNPNASFSNVPLRRLIAAANAARESGPDTEGND